jgi:hypothetical protein
MTPKMLPTNSDNPECGKVNHGCSQYPHTQQANPSPWLTLHGNPLVQIGAIVQ